jgi:hypothetical protein
MPQLCRCRRECTIFRIDDLPIIELRTRVSAAKEEDNMNYQIQRLSIHAEVHGATEPAVGFLHYWGGTSNQNGSLKAFFGEYGGEMFPEFRNHLLIACHGFRKQRHRIVMPALDAKGRPRATQRKSFWTGGSATTIIPRGPVALALLPDGSILVTEDFEQSRSHE